MAKNQDNGTDEFGASDMVLNDNSFSYTCLMSVYEKETPDNLALSIDSMLNQTVPPNEFLIVKDGPVPECLDEILREASYDNPGIFTFVELENNHGLWYAMREGVQRSRFSLIARMDSDDYSEPQRMEKQLQYMTEHPECDCCGTLVEEFEGNLENIISLVELPETHEEIVSFAQHRTPFRHPTALFRREALLAAGNYQEMPLFEDYDLALRLISSGAIWHNLQEPLVKVRVSPSFFERRGNKDYLHAMRSFRKTAFRRGDITFLNYLFAVGVHSIVCMLPNTIRIGFYRLFLRKTSQSVKLR